MTKSILIISVILLAFTNFAEAQKYWHDKERTIRYTPDGTDFVITNGNRKFTRAFYGGNTAFRVEAGDLPEFALYMPGMGGNYKFGLISDKKSKWITTADKVTARYRPGCMLYEIEDGMLGKGKLYITVLAETDIEGMIIKARFENTDKEISLCWMYGGASSKKFTRDGDMGPDPESSFYLKPEYCKDNRYTVKNNTFNLQYGTGKVLSEEERYQVKHLPAAPQETTSKIKEHFIAGVVPAQADIKIVDAALQASPLQAYTSAQSLTPAVSGKLKINNNTDYYFRLVNNDVGQILSYDELPKLFAKAEQARQQMANRIIVHTPDPYINTIGGALSMAADAIWEAPSYLHGSIGWRMRLNGWRGPYTGDVLGWHDRARMHFKGYALSQLTSPESGPVIADTALHFARQLEKLGTSVFSSGYISRNPGGDFRPHHYDMNLVYIDELLWHFNWTGDTSFVREMWPLIKRHLAWEKRNFDADDDGLYDAYAAIWASDALQYSGGGVTHSSAYNYRANKMAAQLAALLGEDGKPYEQEAVKIKNAIEKKLWMPEKGWYAEFKDWLGLQNLHDHPAVWSLYHSLDSDVPDAFQAYQCMRYIDTQIPHIPVKAKGVAGDYYTISTSNWMPYTWSLNNVAMAEVMHTSLAQWQAGKSEDAFKLWKSCLLESMYLGGSPGNFVQISFYDAIRGEAYRDFGDPIGMASRSLIQGLFGILPDELHNKVIIKPGFPKEWNEASLHTPDIDFDFKRTGLIDRYTITPAFQKQLEITLEVKLVTAGVKQVIVNNKPCKWKLIDSSIGAPAIAITCDVQNKYEIEVQRENETFDTAKLQPVYAEGSKLELSFPHAIITKIYDPQNVLHDVKFNKGKLSALVAGEQGSRTAFVQLKQGNVSWWQPLCIELKPTIEVVALPEQPMNELRFYLKNNTDASVAGKVSVNGYEQAIVLPVMSASKEIVIGKTYLIPGSNAISFLYSGGIFTQTIVNWRVLNPTNDKREIVNFSDKFNDRVTQIFKNKYLSPRPSVPTLQLPTQGIGEWTYPLRMVDINDNGLRKSAEKNNTISLPQGIDFSISPDSTKPNILFTSRWDNYPHEATVPLSGSASHAYFLMAGSTNPMQSRITNGNVIINYTDGSSDTLALKNPETWWPIDEDYYNDGYAFNIGAARPVRVHLKTGKIVSDFDNSMEQFNGKSIDGGAATVLDMPLNKSKQLKQLTLQTVANDVVIGLMAVTVVR